MHKLLFLISLLSLNSLHAMRPYALAQVGVPGYCEVVGGALQAKRKEAKKKGVKKDNQTCMQNLLSFFSLTSNNSSKK